MELTKLGTKVRAIRKAKGVTLKQLAEDSDVTVPTLIRIERNRSCTTANLMSVISALGIRLVCTLSDRKQDTQTTPAVGDPSDDCVPESVAKVDD